jgi:hypothetical protein
METLFSVWFMLKCSAPVEYRSGQMEGNSVWESVKTLCVLYYNNIRSLKLTEVVIVPVLKSVARERLMETTLD